jgi:SAM-dependent methyltransferase
MERSITPEILDHLRSDDPRAIRSRKDLQRVNRMMGNAQFQAASIIRLFAGKKSVRILEIGCGDGTFMLEVLKIANKSGLKATGEVFLLDMQEIVSETTIKNFAESGWSAAAIKADLFQWLRIAATERFDLIACNLFLHHFHPEALRKIFAAAAACADAFFCTEPRRNLFCLGVTQCLWLIGCNDVTRHDAPVSIHAGFNQQELQQLWPESRKAEWKFEEKKCGLFTHWFGVSKLSGN